MKLTKVKSSNIDAIGFIEEKKLSISSQPVSVLRVLFTNGRCYDYFKVSPELYQAFLESESKGKFFHKHINNNYDYEKINLE